jgi:hypothetical protein
MFYQSRFYDPQLGRFTQADTIIPESTQGTQAWDRYAFVNNNPVRYNDPTGHMMDQGEGGCTIAVDGVCTTIVVEDSFTDEEEALILQVLAAYARLFGGYGTMESNLALTEINQDWVDPGQVAFYDDETQSITLPYGWYSDALYQNPNGTFTISTAPMDIESLTGFPSGSLPTDEVSAQFVLAHEMGHAFATGNPGAYDSFKDNVSLPWSPFGAFSSNPLIRRNAGRGAGEVFADVMASALYSPGLLNQEMSNWLQMIFH